jgi:pilus assembly protein Flp/PilA
MRSKLKNPLKNQKGQGLLEYIILIALVGVASMGMIRLLQHSIKANFANVVFALQDDTRRKASADKVSEEDLRKSDFGDFMNGASSKNQGR